MNINSRNFTLAELEALICQDTPGRIKLHMALAAGHEERLKLVEDAIDWIAQEFTKTRQLRQDMSEDALSVDIVINLKAMGFQASHDTQYGGHCDIVVEAKDDFLWIAEAKKHTNYDWLLKGFEQLDRRYSTGLFGQDAGEIIIYCFGKRMDNVLTQWSNHLAEARNDVSIFPCTNDSQVLRSTHTHVNTGRIFRVRHKGIPLHFSPTV